MSTVRSIAKNTTFLLISQALNFLLAFFYMTYSARALGPAGYGVLTFALAFTGIFSILADFGLQMLMPRDLARDKNLALKYLANFSLMKVIFAIITYGLIAATINLMGYPWQSVEVVYLLGVSVVFNAFTLMFYAVFQAYERLEFQAIGQLLNSALIFIAVLIAVRYSFSVTIFAYIYLSVAFVVMLYSYFVLKSKAFKAQIKWTPNIMEMDKELWKSTLKKILPFGLSTLFVMAFYWISTILLSVMKGDAEVGWYNASYRMVLVLSFIPSALMAAIYPVMSKLHLTSQDSLKVFNEKAVKYLGTLGIPMAVGTTLLANRIILLVFGTQYQDSVIVLQILIWSELCIFISMPFGNLFNATNKQTLTTVITSICLALNVVLNLVLIPKYGVIGASITTVSTEALSLLLCLGFAAGMSFGISGRTALHLAKALAAGVLMGLYIWLAQGLNLILLIASAVLLYFVVLYALRGIEKEDIDLIRTAVSNRRG